MEVPATNQRASDRHKAAGIARRGKPKRLYSSEDDAVLRAHYPTAPRAWLIERLGRSWDSIQARTNEHLGLVRPNIRTSQLLTLLSESPLNCYWWGLIVADGHITDKGNLKVKLHSSDSAYLAKLAAHIGCGTRREGKMIVIEAMDRVNGLALKNLLGLKKRKTYNPPDNTGFLHSRESILAFLIGIIDGDGSVTYRNWAYRSSVFQSIRIESHGSWLAFFNELSARLLTEGGIPSTVRLNTRGFTQVYLGTAATFATLQRFSAANKLPVLERKWRAQ